MTLLTCSLWTSLLLMMPILTHAAVTEVRAEGMRNDAVKQIKVTYSGAITPEQIMDLMETLDKVNVSYPNAQRLTLYLNSGGGNMDSGYMGYQAIKNSRIPVTTVNAALVGSSASLLFCAGTERQSFPESHFILHPASATVNGGTELKPDTLSLLSSTLTRYNEVFKTVYQTCTRLKAPEIDEMLSAENKRKDLSAEQAKSDGLIHDTTSQWIMADVSYFIQPDKRN